eukprot:CAMPEP_0119152722 /NCGR_PEP_ID=MMETSP1310-20130426/48222_1 /TAXON_ID=464262 /ORGANISM="Genus nov. species nov., Strain RCC2339" /LENGTH=65 /DNA_ID=CAMNT_0007145119 /DNA_START=156 /DNA_END=353 /DNA_ORIENTATION=-
MDDKDVLNWQSASTPPSLSGSLGADWARLPRTESGLRPPEEIVTMDADGVGETAREGCEGAALPV